MGHHFVESNAIVVGIGNETLNHRSKIESRRLSSICQCSKFGGFHHSPFPIIAWLDDRAIHHPRRPVKRGRKQRRGNNAADDLPPPLQSEPPAAIPAASRHVSASLPFGISTKRS